MVMRSLPYLPNSGTNFATGSIRRIRPSSSRIIAAVVVATTLVSDATSKIVSSVIGLGDRRDGALAVRLAEHDGVATPDQHDRAGRLAIGESPR